MHRASGLILALLCAAAPAAEPLAGNAALAWRWAPLLRQEIRASDGNGLGGRADLLAAVDFDGDWNPRNNWEHAADFPLRAKVYWSVVSTTTHHFLLYLFYHPRDWTDHWFSPRWRDSEHENDFEAVVLMLRRDEGGADRLEAALCVHHGDFRALLPRESTLRAPRDAELLRSFAGEGPPRPVIQQQARGHALEAWDGAALLRDGQMLYRPALTPVEPADPLDAIGSYQLESIFAPGGLYARRDERTLFDARGRLLGDCMGGAGSGLRACESDKASAPWAMDDGRAESGPAGALAFDPARVFAAYFDPPRPFARDYESNPYVVR